ncbi:MAG: hypothetical protein KDC67_03695, partial [Ignavibacteriae bacterium]|nr:hypothetical protein [Ignavibacteriota bacterium]
IEVTKIDNNISIRIEDNGKGYNPIKNLNHKSKGIEVVSDRITIFNKTNKFFNLKFKILNKKEIDNFTTGTIIIFGLIKK